MTKLSFYILSFIARISIYHYVLILFFISLPILNVKATQSICEHVQEAQAAKNKSVPLRFTRVETVRALIKASNPEISPDKISGKPTQVYIRIYLASIDEINDERMTISFTFNIRSNWVDQRLNYSLMNNVKDLEMDTKVLKKFWVPDVYLSYEIQSKKHDVTVPNTLLHIKPNGQVFYITKLGVHHYCLMNLRNFPFDSQVCIIDMESYGFSNQSISFRWAKTPIKVTDNLHLTEFVLTGIRAINYSRRYAEGVWDGVRAELYIRRTYGYYITQIYLPSGLIVILSWLSFWLDVEAVAARISMGVLTIVTLYGQLSDARRGLPNVPYVKAVDVWIETCLFFLLMANIQFAIVNLTVRNESIFALHKAMLLFKRDIKHESEDIGEGKSKKNVENAQRVDKVSRLVFPSLFSGFNAFYWSFYFMLVD